MPRATDVVDESEFRLKFRLTIPGIRYDVTAATTMLGTCAAATFFCERKSY